MPTNDSARPNLIQLPVEKFLESVAGKSSTPGGGAVAAITGAQAAALISMVCHYSEKTEDLQTVLETATSAREIFLDLAQEDVASFESLMNAFSQAKESEGRARNIQSALVKAAEAPLKMLSLSATLVDAVLILARQGNRNLITDLGMAAILLSSCASSAELNVLINLKGIKDQEYTRQINASISAHKLTISSLENIAPEIRTSLLTS